MASTSLTAPSLSTWRKKSSQWRHKKAAEALVRLHKAGDMSYRELERRFDLSEATTHEDLANRYHYHLTEAGLSLKEHNLLYPIRKGDTDSAVPYLPISIYLDNLRSAHNVGSIIRTTEALRLGTLLFSPTTPGPDNKKVRDAAMGATVPYREDVSIEDLPRPLIALETAEEAPAFYDYPFPKEFTLLVGNEEYGLSEKALTHADAIVQIPLCGSKNSLNVANAYAIIANYVRQSTPHRKAEHQLL